VFKLPVSGRIVIRKLKAVSNSVAAILRAAVDANKTSPRVGRPATADEQEK
jgi:hypothetical protein